MVEQGVGLLDRLCARRYVVLVAGALVFWAHQLTLNGAAGGTWTFYLRLALDGQKTFPIGAYTGPLSVVFAYPFRALPFTVGWVLASAVLMALGVLSIRWIEQAVAAVEPASPGRDRAVLLAGLFMLYAWSLPAVQNGHPDDVIGFTGIALAMRAVARDQWKLASAGIGIAIAGKPWAALALPLAGACTGARIRGVALAVGGAIAASLPFVLSHHGSFDTRSLNLTVSQVSGLHFLGVAVSTHPSWPRLVQLGLAWSLGSYAVLTRRWYLVPMIAFSVRINLDPESWPYYYSGPIFGMLAWDLARPLRLPGLRTALVCIAFLMLPTEVRLLPLDRSVVDQFYGSLRLLLGAVAAIGLFTARGAGIRPGRGNLK